MWAFVSILGVVIVVVLLAIVLAFIVQNIVVFLGGVLVLPSIGLAAVLLALIPAFIAKSKGRSFWLWLVYGFIFFPLAFIHSLLIDENKKAVEEKALADGSMKKCEFCAEAIRTEATVCKHCSKTISQ